MLLIYSPQFSNRLQFSCNLIFQSILKVKFEITGNIERFKTFEGAKLNYSSIAYSNALQIIPSKLLYEENYCKQDITIGLWRDLPIFFETKSKAEIPFDLLAVSFYLASRYEEYDPLLKLDNHERFQAEESLAYQAGFYLKPLINLLCLEFKQLLLNRYPDLEFVESEYQFVPTFDIDTAFDYLGKGVFRTIGAFGRDLLHLNFQKIKERCQVVAGKIDDPFDNFKFIIDFLKENNIKSQFFVNMGTYGAHDKSTKLNYPLFINRLKAIESEIGIDIHPSYKSNKHISILDKEIGKLEIILNRKITKSRQHFLKMKLPETYQNLIKLGIKEDYSMGYASQLGFRASLCTPFKYYDLVNEEETDLMIFPFCFMDGTFTDYLKLSHEEILNETSNLLKEVKKVKGLMMGIWHNSFISDNEEIKALFKDVLTLCK